MIRFSMHKKHLCLCVVWRRTARAGKRPRKNAILFFSRFIAHSHQLALGHSKLPWLFVLSSTLQHQWGQQFCGQCKRANAFVCAYLTSCKKYRQINRQKPSTTKKSEWEINYCHLIFVGFLNIDALCVIWFQRRHRITNNIKCIALQNNGCKLLDCICTVSR